MLKEFTECYLCLYLLQVFVLEVRLLSFCLNFHRYQGYRCCRFSDIYSELAEIPKINTPLKLFIYAILAYFETDNKCLSSTYIS